MINLTASWWSLPQGLKDLLQPKGKTTWNLTIYKNSNGTWGFNIPYLLTFNEMLLGGTELALDWWYHHLTGEWATTGAKLKMKASAEPFEGYKAKAWFEYDDPTNQAASFYYEPTSEHLMWLCPYLPWLFGSKPENLYLGFQKA